MFASRNGATQNESIVGAALDASAATVCAASLSNSRSIGQLRCHARLFWRLRLEQAPRRFILDSLFPSTDHMLAPAGDIISTGGPENRGFAPLTNVVAPAGSQSGSRGIYIRIGICKQGAPSSSGVGRRVGRLGATCAGTPVEEEGAASTVQALFAVLTARRACPRASTPTGTGP